MWLRTDKPVRTRTPAGTDPSCDGADDGECDHARRLRLEMIEHRRQREHRHLIHHQQEMVDLVTDLLIVIDTVDAARRHQITGTDLLHRQLHQVLGRHGIERLDGNHQLFDPTVHEAARHEPGDGPPTVVDLLRPGYRWKGRVLRPALVAVRG